MSQRPPVVLLIDDQWGRPDDPMIPDRYGHLAFDWRFESAEGESGCYSAAKALAAVKQHRPDVVLLDIMFGMEARLGVEILEKIRGAFPLLPVIMFTNLESGENRELVIRCMELGANEYLEKTPPASQMDAVLHVYTSNSSDRALYGNSFGIRQLRAAIARISFSGAASILIHGESGTGKELVAAALHRQGARRSGPFVAKNCAHSESQLLDSELFGHSKGAFTGAAGERKGLLEDVNGGVLFLDEVADIPLELQAKLLRVLETRSFRPLGRNAEVASDFQLVCATNQPPDLLEKTGRLRSDFYYRIAGITVAVPPLRQRAEDLPILAELFLRRFKERGGAGYPGDEFSTDSMRRMRRYDWPGNVRELRNLVERSLIFSRDCVMEVEELGTPRALQSATGSAETQLPEDPVGWPRSRIVSELRACLEAKQRIQQYKGDQWKAEFMRLMYPECRAANAKGFTDLVKRLTQGPWGDPRWRDDPQLNQMLSELIR